MTRKKVILYLDDSPVNLQLMRFIVHCEPNIRILLCSQPRDVFQQLKIATPDLVFANIDTISPAFIDLLDELKGQNKSFPLIGVSRNVISEQCKQQVSCDGYIEDLFNVESVLQVVRDVLKLQDAAID